MIGDGNLGDSAFRCLGSVDVDENVGIGREVRVQMGIEGQVGCPIEPLGGWRLPVRRLLHPVVKPSSRPTLSKAVRLRSSISSLCAAETIVRMRALSRATVG